MPILGALLSLAVIVGVVVIIHRLRSLMRYRDAKAQLARLTCRPADPIPIGRRSKVTLISCLGRKVRLRRAPAVAGSGIFGVLATCAVFLVFSDGGAPPVAEQPSTVRTVTTTITQEHPRATITRVSDGPITVIRPQPAAAPPQATTTISPRPATEASQAHPDGPSTRANPSTVTTTSASPPVPADGPSSTTALPTPPVTVASTPVP